MDLDKYWSDIIDIIGLHNAQGRIPNFGVRSSICCVDMCWIGNGDALPRGVPQGDRETLYIARVNQNHFAPLLRSRQRGGEGEACREWARQAAEATLEAEEARPFYGMESILAGTAYTDGWEGADAGSAQEVQTEELQQQQQARRRQDMLSRLRLCPNRPRQHGFERRLQGAEAVVKLLRQRVTLPADLEKHGNWQHEAVLLPPISCAFTKCPENQVVEEAGGSE